MAISSLYYALKMAQIKLIYRLKIAEQESEKMRNDAWSKRLPADNTQNK